MNVQRIKYIAILYSNGSLLFTGNTNQRQFDEYFSIDIDNLWTVLFLKWTTHAMTFK